MHLQKTFVRADYVELGSYLYMPIPRYLSPHLHEAVWGEPLQYLSEQLGAVIAWLDISCSDCQAKLRQCLLAGLQCKGCRTVRPVSRFHTAWRSVKAPSNAFLGFPDSLDGWYKNLSGCMQHFAMPRTLERAHPCANCQACSSL